MIFNVNCPHCQARFKAAEEHLGKRNRCKRCGRIFTVERATQPRVAVAACPECGAAYNIKAEFLGKRTRCRECGAVFVLASMALPGTWTPPATEAKEETETAPAAETAEETEAAPAAETAETTEEETEETDLVPGQRPANFSFEDALEKDPDLFDDDSGIMPSLGPDPEFEEIPPAPAPEPPEAAAVPADSEAAVEPDLDQLPESGPPETGTESLKKTPPDAAPAPAHTGRGKPERTRQAAQDETGAAAAPRPRGLRGGLIALVVILVLAGLGVGAWFHLKGRLDQPLTPVSPAEPAEENLPAPEARLAPAPAPEPEPDSRALLNQVALTYAPPLYELSLQEDAAARGRLAALDTRDCGHTTMVFISHQEVKPEFFRLYCHGPEGWRDAPAQLAKDAENLDKLRQKAERYPAGPLRDSVSLTQAVLFPREKTALP